MKLHEPEQSLRFENNGNENDTINKVPKPPTKGQPNRTAQQITTVYVTGVIAGHAATDYN